MSSRNRLLLGLLCLLVLGSTLALSLVRLARHRGAMEAEVRRTCSAQAQEAARAVGISLRPMEALVHGLVQDLESGRTRPGDLPSRLQELLAKAPPSASRLGVLFQPFAADRARRLCAPYVERTEKGVQRFPFEAAGDYTQDAWYLSDLVAPSRWNEPRRNPADDGILVDYSEPVRLPGAKEVSGLVRVEFSILEIQKMVGSLAPSSSGYGFLLSAKGVYLADPVEVRVRKGLTFEAVAREMKDEGRLRLAGAIRSHHPGFAESTTAITGQQTWMFLEPVQGVGWTLGLMILKDELPLTPGGMNRVLLKVVTLGVGASLAFLYLVLGIWKEGGGRLWIFSTAGSLLVAAGTVFLWHFAYTLHEASKAREVTISSEAGRDAFLANYAKLGSRFKEVHATFVRTGIFIQQMEMSGAGRMRISGQVWERFPAGFPAEGRGVVFPEAVSCEIGQGYTRPEGADLVQVYPFRGVFSMQPGSTVNYPFDHTSVRLRIWPRLFYSTTVLVPDLEAYTLLVPVALPGIDKGLGISGWKLGDSHFSFLIQSYNTNFGISDFSGQQDSPELVYTFSLRRNFTNPFIATFLPILVVAGLLFALLMTTSVTRELIAATGYNAINVLRSVISLFFPVVISQINLRNNILTEGLLYVEYYYFVIYILILMVAVNALAVAFWERPALRWRDNRVAKLLFWPVLSLAFYGISTLYLA